MFSPKTLNSNWTVGFSVDLVITSKYLQFGADEKPEELLPGKDKDGDEKEKGDKETGIQGAFANGCGKDKHR